MNVEVRFYKRFDMDLFALFDAGYPIAELMREAVQGFAHKQPVHIEINDPLFFDSNDKNTFRTRFVIPNDDVETINMLKTIKHRCRSNFCKAVLRNALVNLPLTAYFSYDSDYSLYEGLSDVDTSLFPRLIHLERDIIDGENSIKRWSRGKIKKFLKSCVSDDEAPTPKARAKSRNTAGMIPISVHSGSESDPTMKIATYDKKVAARSNAEAIAAKFGAEISGTTMTDNNTGYTDIQNNRKGNHSLDGNFIENNIENVPPNEYNVDTSNQNVRSGSDRDISDIISHGEDTVTDAAVNIIPTESDNDNRTVAGQAITIPPTVSSPIGAVSAGHRRRRFTYDPSESRAQVNLNNSGKTDIREDHRASETHEADNTHEQNMKRVHGAAYKETAYRYNKIPETDVVYEKNAAHEPTAAYRQNGNSHSVDHLVNYQVNPMNAYKQDATYGQDEMHEPDASSEVNTSNEPVRTGQMKSARMGSTRMESVQDTYNTETDPTTVPSFLKRNAGNDMRGQWQSTMFFTQTDTTQIPLEDEEPDFEDDSLMDSLLDMMGDD